ncbi:MAG: S8 family serine peptidase [Chloroflexota bacterium]
MNYSRATLVITVILLFVSFLLADFSFYKEAGKAQAQAMVAPPKHSQASTVSELSADDLSMDELATLSNRVIVELSSPSLALMQQSSVQASGVYAKLDVNEGNAQAHLTHLQREQTTFSAALSTRLPGAMVDYIIDEDGNKREATYQVIFNGIAINLGTLDRAVATTILQEVPGVKAVYADKAYLPHLYRSVATIHAPEVWNRPEIGGQENAGQGIRIASVDSGVHSGAPMFDGTGYTFPPDVPLGGYGSAENNNGKIIASRAYFRSWDPPIDGEQFAWPGPSASSHGTHTASTAAGDWVTTTIPIGGAGMIAGIAPKAYVMSYKVNYASGYNMPFFFTAELLMALEDAVRDGADIINNSWGGGPSGSGGELDPVDNALINAAKAGVFVVMSAGNSGPGTGTSDHHAAEYITVAAGDGQLVGDRVEGEVVDFSSRGPGVGNVLKPDIVAPGKEILAQGYDRTQVGEAQHFGFGIVSGTSMAAPHVSGAVALVKQVHPDWSNQAIKSALMSTAQYTGILREEDGEPAQPLDMGAGWLNVAAALDPGVLLDPPSLSFGLVVTNTQKTLSFRVSNITSVTETYTVTSRFTGDEAISAQSHGAGNGPDGIHGEGTTTFAPIQGFSTQPFSLTLAPNQSEWVTVTFDAAQGKGYGDNQGYIVLTGDAHEAHLPAWARVSYATSLADVLLLDNDGSEANEALYEDVTAPYINALRQLGYSYDIHAINKRGLFPTTIPDAAQLMAYKAIVLFSGTNGREGVLDSLHQTLTEPEMDRLVEYLNNNGALIVMGSSMARVMQSNQTDDLRAPFLYRNVLGANWIQPSVTKNAQPTSALRVMPISSGRPMGMDGLLVNSVDPEMDELDNRYHNGWPIGYAGIPLLYYPGTGPDYGGYVAMIYREQPSIERPGITYTGRTLYTTFGLESVDDSGATFGQTQAITRTALLETFLDWAMSEPPEVDIEMTVPTTTTESYQFMVTLTNVTNRVLKEDENATKVAQIRWSFSDEAGARNPTTLQTISKSFIFCQPYRVSVEVTDWNRNVALQSRDIDVTENCLQPQQTFIPLRLDR